MTRIVAKLNEFLRFLNKIEFLSFLSKTKVHKANIYL